jgi:hypothetical protein
MSLRLVKAVAETENLDDFHLGRLLVLLGSADARKSTPLTKAKAVEGITKLAKLDFLLRYPTCLGRALQELGTLSSGGKKTLFKCCFAIAIHRLAVQLGAPLPELLIIDSPMKNISERENREQFEGFYRLLYELKEDELRRIQLVLIDKEFSAPESERQFTLIERHMRPSDSTNPPLIPYYDGK